ncbi:hypothetical protein Theos_0543 [Thermus oshimai JL-2]|uniref:Uncharacterized protein n=1 Tax=Thermus oshimai JL-2 TaxID=751945 RepID=K7RGB4_THEOS|nr:hypothetical protein [Thermus oshimai]AFV75607.1 hypothetical protein Theos_0543 [Thermus oshimai JL-2]
MKRALLTLSALLALGLALANGPDDEYNVGDQQATVTERITLTIPQRVALHLTEDEWVLDLNNPPLGNQATGEGCFLVPKDFEGTLEDALEAALAGDLRPMDAYPAAKDLDGDGTLENHEKGTLICINQKVLQKFCNNGQGCELDLKVTRTLGGPTYGKLGVKDIAEDIGHERFVEIIPGTNDDGDPLELLKVLGNRLPGWLDDLIIEAFWFDGTEVAGTYEFNFLFQLAAL